MIERRDKEPNPTCGFTQISNDFIRSRSIGPEGKLVGIVYASHADGSNLAWPGESLLMAETGLGRDALRKARKELVGVHYLKLLTRHDENGKFTSPKFRVSQKLRPRKPPTEKPATAQPATAFQATKNNQS